MEMLPGVQMLALLVVLVVGELLLGILLVEPEDMETKDMVMVGIVQVMEHTEIQLLMELQVVVQVVLPMVTQLLLETLLGMYKEEVGTRGDMVMPVGFLAMAIKDGGLTHRLPGIMEPHLVMGAKVDMVEVMEVLLLGKLSTSE